MLTRRCFLAAVVTVALARAAAAQSVYLGEAPLLDASFRVKLKLDVKGKIIVQRQGKTEAINHQASAEHRYTERVLAARYGMAERAARWYEAAQATIAGQPRSLRPDRALMVAHRLKDRVMVYSPRGPLFPEEMELTEHIDTLALPGLLPNKEVKVGETWIVPTHVVQALCGLDSLEGQFKQEVVGELKSVVGNVATISLHGVVKGRQLGAPVAIHVTGATRLTFDIKQQRLTAVAWRQSDERAPGPANPHLALDVAIDVERSPGAAPPELGDAVL
ncbi:MAG: hypothetical protein NZO58_11260, partial [Gemmataceae bacterium]|nr:hypothetical protein [Gemmataceae bacterium]